MTKAAQIKKLYKIAAEAKAAVEKAIYDEEITEEAFDALSIAECEAYDELAAALVDFSKGELTERDGNNLVLRCFDSLGETIAKLAA